jgi:hypothetical protein
MLDDDLKKDVKKKMRGVPILFFSSFTSEGIQELKDALWAMLNQ